MKTAYKYMSRPISISLDIINRNVGITLDYVYCDLYDKEDKVKEMLKKHASKLTRNDLFFIIHEFKRLNNSVDKPLRSYTIKIDKILRGIK